MNRRMPVLLALSGLGLTGCAAVVPAGPVEMNSTRPVAEVVRCITPTFDTRLPLVRVTDIPGGRAVTAVQEGRTMARAEVIATREGGSRIVLTAEPSLRLFYESRVKPCL